MIRSLFNRRTPRQIQFNSQDDVQQAAERRYIAKHIDRVGAWTAGQAFEHLAKSLVSSIQQSKAVHPIGSRVIAKTSNPCIRYGLPEGVQIAVEFSNNVKVSPCATQLKSVLDRQWL